MMKGRYQLTALIIIFTITTSSGIIFIISIAVHDFGVYIVKVFLNDSYNFPYTQAERARKAAARKSRVDADLNALDGDEKMVQCNIYSVIYKFFTCC